MGARSCALPLELLCVVFDYLELTELLHLMLVSRHWMYAAMDHRTYWRSHVLWSASDEAMPYFVRRLDRAGNRPVNISIIRPSPSAKLAEIILPAVAAHLHHTTELVLELHLDQSTAAFNALRHPAPLLHFFMLEFENDASVPVLPRDIFSGVAPVLRSLVLQHVAFPDPIPPVLKAIETLEYGFHEPVHKLEQHRLAEAFPSLQNLMIRNCCSWGSQFPLWPTKWQRIEWLLLSVSRDTLIPVFPSILLANIKGLVVNGVPHDMIPHFLHDIPGDVRLCFVETPLYPPSFRMCLENTDTDRVRGIIIRSPAEFMVKNETSYYLFVEHAIALRITRLQMPIPLWRSLARFLPALKALLDLEVIIYNHGDLSTIGGIDMLLCPRLRRLTICSMPGMLPYVATRELEIFAREKLRGVSYPIALDLRNVLLEGVRDFIAPYCQPIVQTVSTTPTCPYPFW